MAGFGGSNGGGGSNKKKGAKKNKKSAGSSTAMKLKPKGQWDKYKSLKNASQVRVAVRVVKTNEEGDDAEEWFEVGKIKSEGDEFTELAVVLQRGIIVEVSDSIAAATFVAV